MLAVLPAGESGAHPVSPLGTTVQSWTVDCPGRVTDCLRVWFLLPWFPPQGSPLRPLFPPHGSPYKDGADQDDTEQTDAIERVLEHLQHVHLGKGETGKEQTDEGLTRD